MADLGSLQSKFRVENEVVLTWTLSSCSLIFEAARQGTSGCTLLSLVPLIGHVALHVTETDLASPSRVPPHLPMINLSWILVLLPSMLTLQGPPFIKLVSLGLIKANRGATGGWGTHESPLKWTPLCTKHHREPISMRISFVGATSCRKNLYSGLLPPMRPTVSSVLPSGRG